MDLWQVISIRGGKLLILLENLLTNCNNFCWKNGKLISFTLHLIWFIKIINIANCSQFIQNTFFTWYNSFILINANYSCICLYPSQLTGHSGKNRRIIFITVFCWHPWRHSYHYVLSTLYHQGTTRISYAGTFVMSVSTDHVFCCSECPLPCLCKYVVTVAVAYC